MELQQLPTPDTNQGAPLNQPVSGEAEPTKPLKSEELFKNAGAILALLNSGEQVDPASVNPRTHGAETVALVHQAHRQRAGL